MQGTDPAKFRNALWWITSIAISVVCCSVLFILFASYLADMKDQVKDTNMRITSIEARQDRLLLEIEALARRGNGSVAPAVVTTPAPAAGDVSGAAVAVPVTPPAPEAEPASAAPAAPQVTVPTMPENK